MQAEDVLPVHSQSGDGLHASVQHVRVAHGEVGDVKMVHAASGNAGNAGDAGRSEGEEVPEGLLTQCVQHCQLGHPQPTSSCSQCSSIVMPNATSGNGEVFPQKSTSWSRRRRRLLLKSARRQLNSHLPPAL